MKISGKSKIGDVDKTRKSTLKMYRQNPGNADAAVHAAYSSAVKHKSDMVIIPGNSFMNSVLHIALPSDDISKYVPNIGTGSINVFVVAPSGEVFKASASKGSNMKSFSEMVSESAPPTFEHKDGKEVKWKIPSGWTVNHVKKDKLGSADIVRIQHDNTGLIVEFDGTSIINGKGAGKWRFHDYGKEFEGTFKSIDDVEKIAHDAISGSPKREKVVVDLIKQKLHGWDITSSGDSTIEADFELPSEGNQEYVLGAILYFSDDIEIDAACNGYNSAGNTSKLSTFKKEGIKTINDAVSALLKYKDSCIQKLK